MKCILISFLLLSMIHFLILSFFLAKMSPHLDQDFWVCQSFGGVWGNRRRCVPLWWSRLAFPNRRLVIKRKGSPNRSPNTSLSCISRFLKGAEYPHFPLRFQINWNKKEDFQLLRESSLSNQKEILASWKILNLLGSKMPLN